MTTPPSATSITLNAREPWEIKLSRLVTDYGLEIDDKRPNGGALWVKEFDGANYHIVEQLKIMGFKYKSPRGWWRE